MRVTGTVQGVGFRPYVYRLASSLGLAGFVLNDEHGVVIEVEGDSVAEFVRRLTLEAPPLARVEHVFVAAAEPVGESEFVIARSPRGGDPDAAVAPDTATCDDCLAELFDPADRRYRYPFINCTNCGPRFTIVRGVPYDRPYTTMSGFRMCARCQAEYDDPLDRRFHAQPNACPDCGPTAPALGEAVRMIGDGAVVCIKGIGGFHLACRADSEEAVAALRSRKQREERPFALMVRDLPAARALALLDAADEALIADRARPIVLVPRRPDAPVADAVAPGAPELGLMLPYSPLHHLLLADVGVPLVMTSGNVSDEPIAYRDSDARERLGGIADGFLLHDRPIHTRTDDSVVRRGHVLRRSRGYVPASIPLSGGRPLLAVGAELKSTFCLARDGRAWVGHHIGDLKNYATLRSFSDGIEHFERLFAVTPEVVAHDLHPDYLSTGYALGRDDVVHVAVQHHHAHLAACLAEHGRSGPAVGAIFDGTGYGTDGSVWGGELLVGGVDGVERAAHLWPVRQPGGDRAAQEPWRMACAWLVACGDTEPPCLPCVEASAWDAVARMAASGFASPVTTSVGRLFDAVAALCGLRTVCSYEGQAAIELEAICDRAERGAYAFGPALDARPAILAVRDDAAAGVPAPIVSARFHRGLAAATAAALREVGLATVVLSGGVFQNQRLLALTTEALAGFEVLTPRLLPPNDGGIAYGQAAVAGLVA